MVLIFYLGGQPLMQFGDVREQLALAERARRFPRALMDVSGCLRASQAARTAIVKDREDTPILTGLTSRLTTLPSLEQEIDNAILSEDEIADRASAELAQIRRQIRSANERMRDKLNSMIRSSSFSKFLQDSIITMRGIATAFRSNRSAAPTCPVWCMTRASGAPCLWEPIAVVEMGNDLKQLRTKGAAGNPHASCRRCPIRSARTRMSCAIISTSSPGFRFRQRACCRGEMSAVLPKLNHRGYIKIIRGRHPLIDRDKVVPNSNLWLGTNSPR